MSTNDQQWQMVSSNKGQRKGTITSRRELSDESQPTAKTTSPKPGKYTFSIVVVYTNNLLLLIFYVVLYSLIFIEKLTSSSPRTEKSVQSHQNSPSKPVPNLTKRKSLEDNSPLIVTNRELAFRQLTEQLWAAGLPSSTTACSMSIRSRCSSAPQSERGGGGEDKNHPIDSNNDAEENIDWDEPDIPDEGNCLCFKSC